MEALKEVEKKLDEAAELLTQIMAPHMKPKNVARIKATTDYVGKAAFLKDILQDPELNNDVEKLFAASEKFTQFHLYAE